MKIRLIPKEQSFFDLFEAQARNAQIAAEELLDLVKNYTDIERRVAHILEIEHQGDEVTHEVMHRLNTTFVTPFDREDIHQLATNLDDVLDHIEAAADYLQLHNVEAPHERMLRLTEALAEAAQLTVVAIPNLRRMKGFDT